MNRNRPVAAIGALILALILIVTGVVYATRGPATPTSDALVLNGHAPRTVEFTVAIATGGRLSTSGTVWIDDRAAGSLRATLEVPVVSTSTEFDVRAINKEVYLTSPNLADASGPVWYFVHASWPSIARFASFVVKPNVALLTLLANARITHQGFATTYELTRSHVALGTFGVTTLPTGGGSLDVRVSTGAQGEFTGLWAALHSGSNTTTVTLNVVAYDRPVTIVAPPSRRVTAPAGPLLQQLLSSGALGSLVLPSQVLQLLSRAKLS